MFSFAAAVFAVAVFAAAVFAVAVVVVVGVVTATVVTASFVRAIAIFAIRFAHFAYCRNNLFLSVFNGFSNFKGVCGGNSSAQNANKHTQAKIFFHNSSRAALA